MGMHEHHRDYYWEQLTLTERELSSSIAQAFMDIVQTISDHSSKSYMLSDVDRADLADITKSIRMCLKLRLFRSWKTDVIHDEGTVLGVQPAGQSSDELLSPSQAEDIFLQKLDDLDELVQLMKVSGPDKRLGAGTPRQDPQGENQMRDSELMLSLLREMARHSSGQIIMPNTMGADESFYRKRHHLELLIDDGYAEWTGPQESIARITSAGYHRLDTLTPSPDYFSILRSEPVDPEAKGNRARLIKDIVALEDLTAEEAKILSDLIAAHNDATEEDPVGKTAWNWIRERIQEGHVAFSNILRTTESLNRIYNAARNFWGIAKTMLGISDNPEGPT